VEVGELQEPGCRPVPGQEPLVCVALPGQDGPAQQPRYAAATDQVLLSACKKPIMRESDGRRSLIKNPWTYGRIASAATATAEAGT
jgi:hypothetical protein